MDRKLLLRSIVGTALLGMALLPEPARAHCDGMDGPVVKAAQRALAEGDVNRVLIWVQPSDEQVVKIAFQKTLSVRKLNADAAELADMHFFETLVRLHRAGEGEPYTGLKPAGQDHGPVITAADKAIVEEDIQPLLKLLDPPLHASITSHFNEVLTRKRFRADDLEAGRDYVAAYVTFMHAAQGAHAHGDAKQPVRRKDHDMTTQLDGRVTVRDLVGRYPQTKRVFEKYGIDYCCGGAKPLADAAKDRDVTLPELIGALEQALQEAPNKTEAVAKDWYAAPLGELVEHIVGVHHSYTGSALLRLRSLVPTVLKAHGAQHGETLRQVQALCNGLDAELSNHLMKEEQVLFPYIVAIERQHQGGPRPRAPFGSANNPIRQMEHEHDNAGAALVRLRQVTEDYALPADACPTYQAMYEELQRLEADLHEHIHLENNILFPRAISAESRAAATDGGKDSR